VGAVVAVEDESFMIAGIDHWPVQKPTVHEPRLEQLLKVQGFALPPASEHGNDVPVVRFPMTYFCSQCGRLADYNFFGGFGDNKCAQCSGKLVPSRFVVACSKGHIDDFPYFEWVHKGLAPPAGPTDGSRPKVRHRLSIKAGGVSASLRDIVISCSCGVPPTTLHGAFGKHALDRVKHCSGRRPWLGDHVPCEEIPRTLQRGASNAYFAVVRSALSIPPWSEGAMKIINEEWHVLQHIPDDALAGTLTGMDLAKGTPYTVEDLVRAVRLRKTGETTLGAPSVMTEEAIRVQEYEALVNEKEELSADQDFVCVPASVGAGIDEWFEQVMLVKRLREVRVLTAFTRLQPPTPGDPDKREALLSRETLKWLPAVEVIGEGVFLRLRPDRLQAWEARPDVRARVDRIDRNYKAKFTAFNVEPDRTITPRHVLIHTLAHVLVTQWSLASGYPAASLRERLYVSPNMAGLLIYTATSDSAGSLGGVTAQAEYERLHPALQEAIERTAWCSADPLCIEADAQGANSLNLAACHACVLLPEVSCEEANGLLDRALLVGTPENPDLGFFAAFQYRR
jgi:hypothetical protein